MVTTSHVTVNDFETMALDGLWELIDGELVEVTPAADVSASTSMTIGAMLFNFVTPNRLGRLYSAEGGFVLFPDWETVRTPDIAFVAAERAPQGEARNHFPRLAPDLAVEVLSPSDRMSEALAKVAMYLEAGVRLVWLVDPLAQMVTVFHHDAPPVTLDASMTIDGGEVLPGFSTPVAAMFA